MFPLLIFQPLTFTLLLGFKSLLVFGGVKVELSLSSLLQNPVAVVPVHTTILHPTNPWVSLPYCFLTSTIE
jgi:hypothetical protein